MSPEVHAEREVAGNVGTQLAGAQDLVLARHRLDGRGGLEFVSASVRELIGYTPEELHAAPDVVERLVHPDDAVRLPESFGRRPAMAEVRIRHRDGHWVWTELSVAPVLDAGGAVVGIDAVIRDTGDRKALEQALAERALHDSLTGLPNRGLLLDRLEGAIARARRSGHTVAVLLLDIDRFKLINDTYGHAAGDQLLRTLAGRLTGAVRSTDTVGRIGGDEFVVVCDGLATPDDAVEMCERVRRPLLHPITVGEGPVQVSASIGLAIGGADTTADQLLGEADAAMYRAKEQGRNRAEVYDETIRERARRRLDLEAALRRALRSGDIRVHFQPVVSVADGRVVECEALARWRHGGVDIDPAEFIQVAEDAGLIGALGRIVMTEACRQAAGWPHCLAVSVNLSPRQLSQAGVVQMVKEVLAETGLPAARLCLEITESAMVDDLESARDRLTELHRLGVRLSLDDFGTGYSSLLHLRRLPFHQLKVDRSFVAGLGREPSDTAIVAGTVSLAHALGMLVVAEGVETETHLVELRALGCELSQGRFWCPPLPGPDVLQWLAGRRAAGAHGDEIDLRQKHGYSGVLLVDDSTDMRHLVRAAIGVSGEPLQVVGEASDAAGALDAARRLRPDVILLDLVMPDRGGLDVLPDLLTLSPRSRVIVVSGFVSPGLERNALAAGASAYITKGLPLQDVVRRIMEVVSSGSAVAAGGGAD
ncbi:MAG TPA: EAL domain-containing protein [Acidimicrobiales bacterium]|nr:EAL domain-containing protein [Acidimicrobiales bacterium]